MEQTTIDEGKTIAIISYITFIGLIIAYLLNNSKHNAYAQFHIGQSVRIVVLALANSLLGWVLPYSLSIITTLIGIGILVLIILGVVNAINGKTTPLPVIGTIGE